MATRVLTITDPVLQEKEVQEAAKALAGGDLIVFPTETVYGVGASAVNAEAIAQLSQLKSRSPDKPFTLHLADPSEAERYAGPLPLVAQRLIRKAWPGPLTIVAPDARPTRAGPAGLVEEAIYYQGTVGLRCPRGAVVQAILSAAGVPVAGSSANLGGRPAPRNAREALASLEGKVALVVDAGPTMYAVASTVVRVGADGSWEVLREGVIPLRRLKRLVRTRILFVCSGNLCRSPMAAGLAARLLANRMGCDPAALPEHGVEVESAGTMAMPGYEASPNAVEVMRERGIDLTAHRSRSISVDALLTSDYIGVMTRGHRDSVLRLAPEVASRVALVDPEGKDIPDPIGGDVEEYRTCARHLEKALAQRLTEIV